LIDLLPIFTFLKNMDLFIVFAVILGVAGFGFTGFFIYNLMKNRHTSARTRRFNLIFLAIAILVLLISLSLVLFGNAELADWGWLIGSLDLAIAIVLFAGQGYRVGFRQMEEDGVGFIRFFQLGSSILLCLAIAPAFFALLVYATRLR
jgi:hypothetical protein